MPKLAPDFSSLAPPVRPPRRWWRVRLTLRATMILVLMIGVPLGLAARLAALPGLESLVLIVNARFSDAGVATLRAFPKLYHLTIHQPDVRTATLDAIRAARLKWEPFDSIQPPDEAAR